MTKTRTVSKIPDGFHLHLVHKSVHHESLNYMAYFADKPQVHDGCSIFDNLDAAVIWINRAVHPYKQSLYCRAIVELFMARLHDLWLDISPPHQSDSAYKKSYARYDEFYQYWQNCPEELDDE